MPQAKSTVLASMMKFRLNGWWLGKLFTPLATLTCPAAAALHLYKKMISISYKIYIYKYLCDPGVVNPQLTLCRTAGTGNCSHGKPARPSSSPGALCSAARDRFWCSCRDNKQRDVLERGMRNTGSKSTALHCPALLFPPLQCPT